MDDSIKNKTDIDTSSDSTNQLVIYQKSNDIMINGSDLARELLKYKRAIENHLSMPVFIAIIALWIPILTTGKFIDLFGYDGNSIRFGYIIFAIIMTMIVVKPFYHTLILTFAHLPYINKYCKNWLYENETDAERKTICIINKCNKDK